MEAFVVLLVLCVENSPVTGEFVIQRTVIRSFDVFYDVHLNMRLSKQSWVWWFDTPSRPLRRRCNKCGLANCIYIKEIIDKTCENIIQTSP